MKQPRHSQHFIESLFSRNHTDKTEQILKNQQAYHSFRAKSLSERTWPERAADKVNATFGSIEFAFFHIIWFGAWLVINSNLIPGLTAFDPYPFGLLTMIVSLEAIFLSVFVLISQNRESQVTDIRSEVDFQINAHAEQEITELIKMVSEICTHLGIDTTDKDQVAAMKENLNPNELEAQIKKEVAEI